MQVVSEVKTQKISKIGVGQGLNSTVWLAEDTQLEQHVALKEMSTVAFGHQPKLYFEEAKKVYLAKSPRVVPIQYASLDAKNSLVRLVMPYFRNGSLQSKIEHEGPLTGKEAIHSGLQILNGLQHIHSVQLLHLDLKPNNCLIADNGDIMVSDFGQSVPVGLLGATAAPIMYCMAWPPEVIQYGQVTFQSDIYQFGYTLYRMLNGEEHYQSQNTFVYEDDLKQAILDGKFPNRDAFLPHVAKRLRTVTRKCLAVDPADRYGTIDEIVNDLCQCSVGLDWKISFAGESMYWQRTVVGGTDHVQAVRVPEGWAVTGHIVRSKQRTKKDWCLGTFKTRKQTNAALKKLFEEAQ